MGNCLVLQEEEKAKRMIKIMAVDGTVLAYRSPFKLLHQARSPKAAVAGEAEGAGIVRVKLVVSKQELKQMLSNGGVSLGEMISQLQSSRPGMAGGGDHVGKCGGWKPVLESIPEVNDFC